MRQVRCEKGQRKMSERRKFKKKSTHDPIPLPVPPFSLSPSLSLWYDPSPMPTIVSNPYMFEERIRLWSEREREREREREVVKKCHRRAKPVDCIAEMIRTYVRVRFVSRQFNAKLYTSVANLTHQCSYFPIRNVCLPIVKQECEICVKYSTGLVSFFFLWSFSLFFSLLSLSYLFLHFLSLLYPPDPNETNDTKDTSDN